ncbi:hypothetical protein HETIRDRAFT_100074 [Heterobasidion irregulare TC 32-1]|uniref:ATP-dependent DNA helicase n=1 Tax=Heterobasidion irregulare (strain TC 32-1) TaxID=747525 RepID=W4KRR9_HETIT|nr:uncharacterized protein HETIRDRAFT_100074 [Heterobasidion irregulare TC 32-1]ETW87766.1 hypothetical protein HETIRDRAFT_100074 [Heterobasidion irregulare TC 32-1]
MAVDDASSGSSVPMYTGASHTGGIVSRSKFFAAAPLTDESDIIHLDDDKEEVQIIESDDELWGSFQPDEPTLVEDVPARSALAVPARRSTPALSSSFQLPPPEPFPYKPLARSPPVFAPAPLDSQSRSAGIHTTLGYDPKTDPLYPEVMNVLKTTYGLTSFRKNQLEAVLATLNGRDVFVLMPTGGGKSLCYQLPAICGNGKTQGVTFVISPLIALMLDQVKELEEKHVDVVLFTGDMAADERIRATNRLNGQGEKPRLVYITPEKLQASDSMMKTMEKLHAANELARFVIDEAHLVSTWGRDFRGSYINLGTLRKSFPNVPIIALTASATPSVQKDVADQLGLKSYVLLSQSFNRANLRYTVRGKPSNTTKAAIQYIQNEHPKQCGVIYCNGRDKCEKVASDLRGQGIEAKHFHAKMTEKDKRHVLQSWKNGRTDVIVGTIAFGMGINHANVRFVLHYDVPSTLIGYYQETGRAGRDGKPADCILYYSWGDCQSHFNRIRENEDLGAEDKRRQINEMQEVIQFCLNDVDCRRVLLLKHFDEQFDPQHCGGTCDNCTSTIPATAEDVTETAISLIHMMEEVQKSRINITRPQAIDVFKGSAKKEFLAKKLNRFDSYGAGKNLPLARIERIFDHLSSLQVFASITETNNGGYPVTYTTLGPTYRDYLRVGSRVIMKFRTSQKTGRKPASKKGQAPRARRNGPNQDLEDDPIDEVEQTNNVAGPASSVWPPPRSAATRAVLHTDSMGPAMGCYGELKDLRLQISENDGVDAEEILGDGTLQALSFILPEDLAGFKDALDGDDADEPDKKWEQYGHRFLGICIKYRMRRDPTASLRPGPSTAKPPIEFHPDNMHQRFDYRSGTSKPSSNGG